MSCHMAFSTGRLGIVLTWGARRLPRPFTRWCLTAPQQFRRSLLEVTHGTSLVAQWLRIRLPVQGPRVRALEVPTCHGATEPMRHNY